MSGFGSCRIVIVAGLAVCLLVAAVAPVRAQQAGVETRIECEVGGRPCLDPEQQAQAERVADQLISERVTAPSGPVFESVRRIVDQWVNLVIQLGFAIGYSFLPG